MRLWCHKAGVILSLTAALAFTGVWRGERAGLAQVSDVPLSIPAVERDPFKSLLPEEPGGPQGEPEPETIVLPSIPVQGILWGTDTPRALINDDVYAVGETVYYNDAEATVFKIEENNVFFMYRGKLFKRGVTK
ncbi:MAG: hypothetical protein GF333_06260 [Candidatus Omnitrophica bacterium]|nr:hypothetical protein [Candidatus Omnitrophota bacterium]